MENNLKVGILYICTGKYKIFWADFFKSAQENFLPFASKEYFVFTDDKYLLTLEDENIHTIYQKKLGWPFDTLMRFHMFKSIENRLKELDYLFFFNANALITDTIGEEILPTIDGLVGVKHPCFYNTNPRSFIYDRNPDSTSFIPVDRGSNYFMGSFSGGKSVAYLEMCNTLVNNIDLDLSKEIIALWHDESHLNKYFLTRSVKILEPAFAYPEEMTLPFEPKILLRDKRSYGGHTFLRKEHRVTLISLIKNALFIKR